MDASLKRAKREEHKSSDSRQKALRKKVEPLELRQARLIQALENEDDPGGVMFQRIRDRIDMDAERMGALEELEKLADVRQPQSPDLLDLLPIGETEPPSEPTPEMHRLFETLCLQLRYDYPANRVRCRIALRSESIDEVLAAAANVVRNVVDVVCAPGRTRRTTTTPGIEKETYKQLIVESIFQL